MAQYLKEEVQEKMITAALTLFAERGYRATKMKEIAESAGVATGNLYRYFENKQVLFAQAVPESLCAHLLGLVRARVEALEGVDLPQPETSRYHIISEDLLRLCITRRLEVVIILGEDPGSPYEGAGRALQADLLRLARQHARRMGWRDADTPSMGFALEQIYRHFLSTLVCLLRTFEEESEIRSAVLDFTRYHLAGLKGFFDHQEVMR